MNLQRLFEEQAKLDAHINENHPPQPGEDRLSKKILALLVELGECANEWRGFKFWSKDQEPRTNYCPPGQWEGYGTKNLLLEEYVDCLHFILSIGLEFRVKTEYWCKGIVEKDIEDQFKAVMWYVLEPIPVVDAQDWFNNLISSFVVLGEKLGFTWQQVETAYMQKNATNHTRQESNY